MKNKTNTLAIKSEELAAYSVTKQTQEEMDNDTVNKALGIIFNRLVVGPTLSDPKAVKSYLSLKMALLEREVFACMFLDTQNRLISYEEMFFGTISQASVYPPRGGKSRAKNERIRRDICTQPS
jgi:DNA repair protein RadC